MTFRPAWALAGLACLCACAGPAKQARPGPAAQGAPAGAAKAPKALVKTRGTADPGKIVLAFGGDVIFDRGIRARLEEHGPKWVFEKIRRHWEDADLVVANLESPVGLGGRPLGEKPIRFRADPSSLDALSHGGVGLVSLSNNHILDYGPTLALQTGLALQARGIRYTGLAWRGKETEPAWVDIKGKKFAFFSYCNVCPGEFDPVGKSPGAAVAHPELMAPDLRRARAKADYVVALMHWGMEYLPTTALQRSLAAGLVEAGADLVIGCHPHVLQHTETLGQAFVAYSLGNLVFDMYDKRTLDSALLKVTLEQGLAPKIQAIPLSVKKFRPEPLSRKSGRARRIQKRLML